MLHKRQMRSKGRKHPKNNFDKCEKTGKTRYPDEGTANRAKFMLWSQTNRPYAELLDLHVYHCEYCKSLHVGHKSYYELTIDKS